MKKINYPIIFMLALTLMSSFSFRASAQEKTDQPTAQGNENIRTLSPGDTLVLDKNEAPAVSSPGSGKLGVLESLEQGPSQSERIARQPEKPRNEWKEKEENNDRREYRKGRFRGHWTGIEVGLNNYLTSDGSFTVPDDINYMSLNSGKSVNFNLNFTQLSLGITRHIGFVTGLGLNWDNYRFDGNNNITKGTNGIIQKLDPGEKLDKSKLATFYLTMPVLLEIQIPAHYHNLILSAGPIGAVKVESHSKMVFHDGHKVNDDGDFSLNMLRYGATARVGYQNLQVYGTYYKTPLFESGKGPGGYDLFPFEVGIAFTFND